MAAAACKNRAGLHDTRHVIHMHQSFCSTSRHLQGHSAKLSTPILHSIGERGSNCDLSSVLGKWSVLTPHFNGHVSYNNNFCVQLNTCSY